MAAQRLLTALLFCSAFCAAQKPPPSLTTIYSFTDGSDGGDPTPLAIGEGGVLYGTTRSGGMYDQGTVFSLTPPASPGGSWTYNLLYGFQGGSDGASESPYSRLTIGSGGVLYGATSYGVRGFSEVYSLTPPAFPGSQWTFAAIASFVGAVGAVAISPGGALFVKNYCPNVYALASPALPGGSWAEQEVWYSGEPCGNRGSAGGVTIGAGLVLYGTIAGTETVPAQVFDLAPPATPGGAWTESVLYQFTGIASGLATDVAIGAGGVLYGTVYPQSGSGGEVYSMTPPVSPGGPWTQATLLEFPSLPQADEEYPGPLTLGENGTLYGTTQYGGPSGAGTAYAVTPPASPGGAWTQIPLHTFTGSDGKYPTRLVIGSGGILYGTTTEGGAYGHGTVFALTE